MGNGVELVVVTPRALEGQPEERRAERVHAIRDVVYAELLLDAAAFVRLPVVPVERRRQALVAGGVGQKVARQLPRHEFVER